MNAEIFKHNCGLTEAQYNNYIEYLGGVGFASFDGFCESAAEQVSEAAECEEFAHNQLAAMANGGAMILAAMSEGAIIIGSRLYFTLKQPAEPSGVNYNSEEVQEIAFKMDGIGFGSYSYGTPSNDGDNAGIYFEIASMFDYTEIDEEDFPF